MGAVDGLIGDLLGHCAVVFAADLVVKGESEAGRPGTINLRIDKILLKEKIIEMWDQIKNIHGESNSIVGLILVGMFCIINGIDMSEYI